jgi:hypothetical protein
MKASENPLTNKFEENEFDSRKSTRSLVRFGKLPLALTGNRLQQFNEPTKSLANEFDEK